MTPFPVLFVCAGNVCRSPYAERLLRLRLDQRGAGPAYDVSSAGVAATVGSAMHPRSAADLVARGGSAEEFAARQLREPMLDHAGLVLAATADLRSRVLELAPGALRRSFTMLELAALAPAAPPALSLPELVRDCASRRSTLAQGDYDVPDPIGRDDAVFAEVATTLDVAVTQIADVLARHRP